MFLADLRALVKVTECIRSIYRENSNESARDYELCHEYFKYLRWIMRMIPALYFSVIIIYQIPSIMEYFETGVVRPVSGIYWPMIDEHKWQHLAILNTYNVTSTMIAVLALIANDLFLFVVFVHVPMIARVVIHELNELQAVLNGVYVTEREVKNRLIKIILMHRKYNE